jgi:hypothetical protein
MKRAHKFIKWAVIAGFAIALVIAGGFVFYLETSIDKVMPEEKQQELFAYIENSPALPESFKTTLKKYYPDFAEDGVWTSLIRQLTGGRRNKCQCRELYLPAYTVNSKVPFDQLIAAFEIEEHFSQWKCYEFEMATTWFGGNIRGVKKAAGKFYNKELHELNEREILELDLIRRSITKFNPLHNRENLDEAVNSVMNRQTE